MEAVVIEYDGPVEPDTRLAVLAAGEQLLEASKRHGFTELTMPPGMLEQLLAIADLPRLDREDDEDALMRNSSVRAAVVMPRGVIATSVTVSPAFLVNRDRTSEVAHLHRYTRLKLRRQLAEQLLNHLGWPRA